MEITRKNFNEYVDQILQDICACDFLSWDGEFTGISNEKYKAMAFDTVEERYYKMKHGNMGYLMCQIGLAMFTKQPNGIYICKPYNCYLLPRQLDSTVSSPEFICQTSCVDFLSAHGFDFNKVFLEGISFLRKSDEDKLFDKLEEKKAQNTSPTLVDPKPEDKAFLREVCDKVQKYMKSGKTDSMNLDPCHAYKRKLIYQTLQQKYPDTLHLKTDGSGKEKFISMLRISPEEKQIKKEEKHEQHLQKIREAIGFSKVVRAISVAKKLVIGHNMLLDLMYVLSQFFDELPEQYKEFKMMAAELFPMMIDTKVMASTYLFKDDIQWNSLDEMLKIIESPPFQPMKIVIPEEFSQYQTVQEGQQRFHEAGFDAYVTGKCFAVMAGHLGKKAEPPVCDVISDGRLLKPFINRLFVNRIPDIPYMNLGGAEVVPDRDHMYHLTFPKIWTRNDIQQVFAPHAIYITWISDTTAMVCLQHRTENAEVKKLLKTHALRCSVITYHEWYTMNAQNQESASTIRLPTLTSPGAKRRKIEKTSASIAKHEVENYTTLATNNPNENTNKERKDKVFDEEEKW